MNPLEATARESRILVVDDDPGTIRVLARILHDLGKVHFTTQGAKALSLAQTVSPDIILLDIEMPDRDGFAVCQDIKGDPGLSEVPVLFVTAHADMDLEARALRTCAIDFVHKPPHPEVVKARVANYLAFKHQTDRLRQLSMIDGLTGVANRRAFDKAAANEWRRACRSGNPLSLLMLDVDQFKRYNDTHGHQAGDDCLRAVANCMASRQRRPGDLVARYGGEEFVMLLPDCPLDHARELAETVRREVEGLPASHSDAGLPASVTISVGVTDSVSICANAPVCWRRQDSYPKGASCGQEPATLIGLADAALYRAKEQGRNRVESGALCAASADCL